MVQNWPPPVREPKLLFVEGREEELLLGAFLRELGIVQVQIQNCRGKDNLGRLLAAVAQDADFEMVRSIGIVRDADNSAQSAFQSVQDSLRNAGLAVPNDYVTSAAGPPRTSAFIMPDNGSNGALEQLCLAALTEDPAMPCVEEFLTCVNGRLTVPPRDQQKARIHAFLASREDSELRLGEAAQRGYIDWNHAAFNDLAQFLRNL